MSKYVVFEVNCGIVEDEPLKILTADQAKETATMIVMNWWEEIEDIELDYVYKECIASCNRLESFSLDDDRDIKILEVLQ